MCHIFRKGPGKRRHSALLNQRPVAGGLLRNAFLKRGKNEDARSGGIINASRKQLASGLLLARTRRANRDE